eukprot:2986576-Rhodomonas_salina.2
MPDPSDSHLCPPCSCSGDLIRETRTLFAVFSSSLRALWLRSGVLVLTRCQRVPRGQYCSDLLY